MIDDNICIHRKASDGRSQHLHSIIVTDEFANITALCAFLGGSTAAPSANFRVVLQILKPPHKAAAAFSALDFAGENAHAAVSAACTSSKVSGAMMAGWLCYVRRQIPLETTLQTQAGPRTAAVAGALRITCRLSVQFLQQLPIREIRITDNWRRHGKLLTADCSLETIYGGHIPLDGI